MTNPPLYMECNASDAFNIAWSTVEDVIRYFVRRGLNRLSVYITKDELAEYYDQH